MVMVAIVGTKTGRLLVAVSLPALVPSWLR